MLTAALVLALGTSAALAQNANTAFEQKAQALNKAAKQGGKMTTALNAISTETGVPQDQVQAMHNSHPGVGAAAILIASVMADQTKKPAENFLQERAGGTSWEAIASANKVPLQTIEQRLDNVQRALTNPQQTAATSTTTPQATTT
ncbi:MAG TPA: hypothetical protein VLT36_18185, partial [Candidatus Dormibacteraeota bacterium]|nr:hypothetical protein [Candidatus Dormibacteraeota bacterium]